MSSMPEGPILNYEGVNYIVIELGGNGWSRGCGSIVEAIDGPNKGKRYRANIGHGISDLIPASNWEQRENYS